MIAILPHADGVILSIVAHPASRRNAVLGERAGAIRIAVTAPPDKGKANAAIQAVLAEHLGCKSAQVALISGAASRQKRFLIRGVDAERLRNRLSDLTAAVGGPEPKVDTPMTDDP